MKNIIVCAVYIVTLAAASLGQSKTNVSIAKQIGSLRAEKSISVTFDQGGNTSKVMAVAGNFSNSEAAKSGVLAINFAAGFFYAGTELQNVPETVKFAFWVLTKKPRFAANSELSFAVGQEVIKIGPSRYAARPREDMEYLNYEIELKTLGKIAQQSDVRAIVGDQNFTLTREQLKLIADLVMISDLTRN